MKVPKNYYSKMLKEDFLNYEEARQSGKYNMVTDMNRVIVEYGISFKNYIICKSV